MIRDLLIAFGAFAVVTALAELLGATNLGTAMTFGTIAFMGAIVALIMLRARPAKEEPPPPARGGRPPKQRRRR